MARNLTGIRRYKKGWQAYVKINKRTHAKSFTLSTPLPVMREWRELQRKKYAPVTGPVAGSFAADIVAYLQRVAAMPTFPQRAAHLELWAQALGRDRPRHGITAAEIDQVMQLWLTTPTNQPDPTQRGPRGRPSALGGLEPATVKKRRTSLLALFNTLDGKQAQNPVRASKNPAEPEAEARGVDYPTLARILTAMPDYQSVAPGAPVTPNRAKLIVGVMATTGFPPSVIQKIGRADLNLAAGSVRTQRRLKGKGVEARTVTLTGPAIAAFRAFAAADAFGWFAVGAVNVAFKRACKRAGVAGVHLYDVRHSYGAELYRQTGDMPTVARAMLHAAGSVVTQRYTKAAHQVVDAAAAAKMGSALDVLPAPVALHPVPRLLRKAAPARISRKRFNDSPVLRTGT